MLDASGRPYFLRDTDMTLARFEELLQTGEKALRVYLLAKRMRQAKPDDVFLFVGLDDIRESWGSLQGQLGRTREFWTWWRKRWGVIGDGQG